MNDIAFTYDDILLVPAYNHYESRRVVDISVEDKNKKLKLELPVFTSNMDTITESKMANYIGSKGGMGVLHRFMSIEQNIEEFKACEYPTFISIGCNKLELERAEALRSAGANYFCLDVAHGHAKYVGSTLKVMRSIAPDACIMAGNVTTYAGADYLASCGADLIKVGVGAGSVCSTRIKTGFGVPMLAAIKDCARVGRSVVADGGLRTPGDIVKALAFGADYVMLGGMLSGTDATPGEVYDRGNGKKVKMYRGMASQEAQENYMGNMHEWKTSEGVSTEVPYRDDQNDIIADIIGGLRSGLTYGGADTVKELQRKLNYVRITGASLVESRPHKLDQIK